MKSQTSNFAMPLTPAQRADLTALQGDLSAAAYVRSLIDADCRARLGRPLAEGSRPNRRGAGGKPRK